MMLSGILRVERLHKMNFYAKFFVAWKKWRDAEWWIGALT